MRTGSLVKSIGQDPWRYAPWILAAGVLVPLATIFSAFLVPEHHIWQHLASTLLPQLLLNTAILIGGVATFTIQIGRAHV